MNILLKNVDAIAEIPKGFIHAHSNLMCTMDII